MRDRRVSTRKMYVAVPWRAGKGRRVSPPCPTDPPPNGSILFSSIISSSVGPCEKRSNALSPPSLYPLLVPFWTPPRRDCLCGRWFGIGCRVACELCISRAPHKCGLFRARTRACGRLRGARRIEVAETCGSAPPPNLLHCMVARFSLRRILRVSTYDTTKDGCRQQRF